MNKKFGDKIKASYDKIADIWYTERDWYIEQAGFQIRLDKIDQPGNQVILAVKNSEPYSHINATVTE